MAFLSLENLIARDLVESLRILGRYNWLHWRQIASNHPCTHLDLRIPHVPELEDHNDFIALLRTLRQQAPDELWALFVQSKLISDGPKVLRPTAEQCEALEHVDVNVSFDEYEQPFPVVVVEVPEAFRRGLSQRFGIPCPRFVMTFHDKLSRYIVSMCQFGPGEAGTFTVLSPRPEWKTIEDALHLCLVDDGPDIQLGEVLYRIAINFGLLLTRFGAKDCGPIDPRAYAKQQEIAQRKKGRKAERARRLLAATVNLLDFEQQVVFCDKSHVTGESTGDGKGKKPHWRRGHFRRQSCGEGRSERKLIFVRPCFINAAHFHGDQADTIYSIRVPQRAAPFTASNT